jgi:phosphomethylpyrimidine synthase
MIYDKLIERLSREENIEEKFFMDRFSCGSIAIPANIQRRDMEKPCAIGEGLSVKVNANIGASPEDMSFDNEMRKLDMAVFSGADTVMDLTVGGSWRDMLVSVLERAPVPVGTVPVYSAFSECSGDLRSPDFIDMVEVQARMGVDFMTIHAGITSELVKIIDSGKRLGGIVSRGGRLIYNWMKREGKENPFYRDFDRLLDLAAEYGVAISLGDGLRPGCLADANDISQFSELETLGELTERCLDRGVQVIIEGPGHVPLNLIEENIKRQKALCRGVPFYILGPLVTDLGAGYDHISGAIGAAFAAWKGADFLCYLTPAEHLHLPGIEDVRSGVIASKIAAHSADIARGLPDSRVRDDEMSRARKKLDWSRMEELAFDPDKVKEAKRVEQEDSRQVCTMCGSYCALIDAEGD